MISIIPNDPYDRKNFNAAVFFFISSTLITWWFIESSPVYADYTQKLLSCSIAGAKWTIQIVFAFLFLQGKKWKFIREIGLTCFVGSIILVPYSISSILHINDSGEFFLSSLIASVAVMIVLYFISVKKSRVPMLWWAGWMLCLAVAITLQLKVVFHIPIIPVY